MLPALPSRFPKNLSRTGAGRVCVGYMKNGCSSAASLARGRMRRDVALNTIFVYVYYRYYSIIVLGRCGDEGSLRNDD